ncbi:MAG: hypothetical protein EP304_07220 [Deltaproteobacteria bacterium]|nr:MAG: hypothetical protein EP304_07220 [Deltaproteobacteria bacterium]
MRARRVIVRFLNRLKPRAIGIDLHWLPHTGGAIGVARLAKECHAQVAVNFRWLGTLRTLLDFCRAEIFSR